MTGQDRFVELVREGFMYPARLRSRVGDLMLIALAIVLCGATVACVGTVVAYLV